MMAELFAFVTVGAGHEPSGGGLLWNRCELFPNCG
jgi:hypothetical protein